MKIPIYIAAFILLGLLSGCSGNSGSTSHVIYTHKRFIHHNKPKVVKPVFRENKESRHQYVLKGVRDPFKPFELKAESKVASEKTKKKIMDPLQRLSLSQIKLVGIIWGAKKRALIEDTSGMGYIIKKGTLLGENSGVVTHISPDGITIEQHFKDYMGRINTREVVLRLRKEEGEM